MTLGQNTPPASTEKLRPNQDPPRKPKPRTRQKQVTGLSCSAHPSAAAELRRAAEVVAEKFKVTGIAAVHRVGDPAIGDLAVVVVVSSPHRAEALDACRERQRMGRQSLILGSDLSTRPDSRRYSMTAPLTSSPGGAPLSSAAHS